MKSTNPYMKNLDRCIKDIALNPLRLKTLKCIRCKEETVVYWDYNSVFCEDCLKIVDDERSLEQREWAEMYQKLTEDG